LSLALCSLLGAIFGLAGIFIAEDAWSARRAGIVGADWREKLKAKD
jgi:hypothetical protein